MLGRLVHICRGTGPVLMSCDACREAVVRFHRRMVPSSPRLRKTREREGGWGWKRGCQKMSETICGGQQHN